MKKGLLSAQELVEAMPDVFSTRKQVLSWATRGVLPYYAVPSGVARRVRILFDLKAVRRKVESYKRGCEV